MLLWMQRLEVLVLGRKLLMLRMLKSSHAAIVLALLLLWRGTVSHVPHVGPL